MMNTKTRYLALVLAAVLASTVVVRAKIAAGTITADKIATGTITATQLAAGTITGDRIAAGTITADRLSVSSLSALSANLGTVTAGSISGVSIEGSVIEAGSDTVRIDDDGIVIDDGSAPVNGVNWTGGGQVRGLSGSLFLSAPNGLSFDSPVFSDTINMHTNEDIILNGASANLVFDRADFKGTNRYLCVDASGFVFASGSGC